MLSAPFSADALAQEYAEPAIDLRSPLSRVLTDVAGDGSIWVRGANYKLHFDATRVEYVPIFGPRAPRNLPLVLEGLEATAGDRRIPIDVCAAPTLDGNRVTYDRGAFLEVWDLGLDEVELSYVLLERTAGDLVLRTGLQSELEGARIENGLVFEAPGLGSVHVGDLVIRDADGNELRAPTRLAPGALELRVPASFLASASLPVVIDPVFSTFSIDGGVDLARDPETSFGAASATWLVVYEDVVSGSDIDILSRRVTASGALLEEVAVDISSDTTVDPSVGYHPGIDKHLIAWTKVGTGFGIQRIRARTRSESTTVQGSTFDIRSGNGVETPDVGGAANGASATWFVVWCETSVFHQRDIRGSFVDGSGSVGGVQDVSTASKDQRNPSISKRIASGTGWLIAYENQDYAVGGQRVSYTLMSIAGEPSFVDTTVYGLDNFDAEKAHPDVAGDGTTFLIVYDTRPLSGFLHDIEGCVVRPGNLFDIDFPIALTTREPGVVVSRDQIEPVAAQTANGFVYAYRELQSPNFAIFAASLGQVPPTGVDVPFVEGHVGLGVSTSNDFDLEIASTFASGGTGLRTLAVFTRQGTDGDVNVVGSMYDHP